MIAGIVILVLIASASIFCIRHPATVLIWIDRIAGRLRGLPDSAASAERILDAAEVREAEHELGVGPFAGRENYCDLTKCTSRNHTHDDVDSETMTGKPAPKPPCPTHVLLPEEPIAVREYREGDTRVTYHDSSFAADRTARIADLTIDQATKMVMAGILAPEALLGALSEPRAYAMGVAPNRKVNPSEVWWNSEAAMRRAAELAYSGRMNEYCTEPWHDHHEIRAMNGTIRRACGVDHY